MNTEERMNLIKQVGEEILTEEELRTLLETKKHPIAYDGFEPSGHPHIAQGVLRATNVNKMTKAGIKFKMYAADWHAWTNLKFGGDLEKIQTAGDYLIEVWKACGMDTEKVEFIRASNVVDKQEYWKKVIQIATASTVKRIVRCGQIMGRAESEVQQASQIIYPCMQCADIFEFKADITQLGMDQRKVNILAREVGPKLGWWAPVVVSHHMLMGLHEPPKTNNAEERVSAMKMSKSKPDTAIFMEDTAEDVCRKISKAYCPEKQTQENPILEYCKYILFEHKPELIIKRPIKFGGNLELQSYQELETAFAQGNIHPMDLKNTVADELNLLLEPIRAKLSKGKAKELGDKVKSFTVTR
ncbi:MAG: tyrosine--tRNA ligase [Candidatus Woesearchaeota archaeon]|nr:tyrosine--tRNA ligase [Candidatus Woesearchaeota archaeon]